MCIGVGVMVRFGIPLIDECVGDELIVELNSNWARHGFELADLINRRTRYGPVHVVIYSRREFLDVDRLYMDMEPFIRANPLISLSWATSIESIVYDLSLLPSTRDGTVFIILPYPWDLPSHELVSKLPMLRNVLKSITRRGWKVVVINPLNNRDDKTVIVHLADAIIKIIFDEETGSFMVKRIRTPVYKPVYSIGLSVF